jgi:hypothetical protein
MKIMSKMRLPILMRLDRESKKVMKVLLKALLLLKR